MLLLPLLTYDYYNVLKRLGKKKKSFSFIILEVKRNGKQVQREDSLMTKHLEPSMHGHNQQSKVAIVCISSHPSKIS